jgi:hypothetical protein
MGVVGGGGSHNASAENMAGSGGVGIGGAVVAAAATGMGVGEIRIYREKGGAGGAVFENGGSGGEKTGGDGHPKPSENLKVGGKSIKSL